MRTAGRAAAFGSGAASAGAEEGAGAGVATGAGVDEAAGSGRSKYQMPARINSPAARPPRIGAGFNAAPHL